MNDKRRIIAIFIIVAIVAALAAVATFFVIKSAKNEAKGSSQMTEIATEDSSDKDDPQHMGDNAGSMSVTSDDGASADETQILSASSVAENSNLTFGIDVSKYQGTIKWDKVAAGGIDFRRASQQRCRVPVRRSRMGRGRPGIPAVRGDPPGPGLSL